MAESAGSFLDNQVKLRRSAEAHRLLWAPTMKRHRLTLERETVRLLEAQLAVVVAGRLVPKENCTAMTQLVSGCTQRL